MHRARLSPVLVAAVIIAAVGAGGCADPEPFASGTAAAAVPAATWIATVPPGAALGADVEVLAPLPGGRVLLRGPASLRAAALRGATGLRPWTPDDRIARDLRDGAASPGPLGRVPMMVHVVPGGDAAAIAAELAAHGHEGIAAVRAGAWSRVAVRVAPDEVAEATALLAGMDDVYFVERIRRVGLLNDKLVGSVQSGVQGNAAAQTPIWAAGLRGEGQIVGVIDTGVDADSCYVDGAELPVTNTWSADGGYGTATRDHRKILAYDFLFSCDQYPGRAGCDVPTSETAWDNHGHGTHIAGTMVGDSDESPTIYAGEDGVAPAAKLVVQDAGYGVDDCADLPGLGCPMLDLTPLYAQAYAQGVRAINNSWGDNENAPQPGGASNYTARTQDVDRFMWEHPDFLIVFAAGNEGGANTEFSVGSPATLKNGLSVGSTRRGVAGTSDDDISSFSSRGWTGDGRIKPDLMAPGCNNSAGTDRRVGGGNCGLNGGCGTSYAAPVAVGAAALVRQYFTDGRYREQAFTPSAALVKAVLINASTGMAGVDNSRGEITPIPSNEQGWGRIQLDRALAFAGSTFSLFVDDHRAPIPEGFAKVFRYAFDVGAGDLKVTLAWTDYPGVPDQPPAAPAVGEPASWTDPQLVNDLDLEVETGDGARYLGNQFVAGRSATGGVPDERNNVEQVLTSLTEGRVLVTVRARRIAVGGQQFALVVTGPLAGGGACQTQPELTPDVDRVDASGVALSWTDLAASGDFRIERADGGCAGTFAEVGGSTAASFVDTAVQAGATYGYRVRSARIPDGWCDVQVWSCIEVRVPGAGDDAGVPDAGAPDAGAPDAGAPDAGAPDAGAPDAGAPDAGRVDPGFDEPGGDDGCGCRTSSPAGALLPLLMAVAALVRPRRSRSDACAR